MTATSLGDLSAQIRLLLTNKGISSIEAIGVLESVKFSYSLTRGISPTKTHRKRSEL